VGVQTVMRTLTALTVIPVKAKYVSERDASKCDSDFLANTPTEGPEARKTWSRREKSSGIGVFLPCRHSRIVLSGIQRHWRFPSLLSFPNCSVGNPAALTFSFLAVIPELFCRESSGVGVIRSCPESFRYSPLPISSHLMQTIR